jgi:glycine/D-amino acid oxidase-like deaminating enzyme
VSDSAHPDTADVVVIGGGVLGCCAAYHLRQSGAGKVILLEREPRLATQTTSAGAGFVALWTAAAEVCEPELGLERYALEFYRVLGNKHAIDLKSVGMVWLATTPDGAANLERSHARARQRVSGDEVALLMPEQLRALVPIVEPARITAALHWPTAIRVSAPLATEAIGHDARSA